MKKSVFFSLMVIFMLGLFSCTNPTVTTTTVTTKTTVTEPGSDGFLLSKQIVVKGNTIWGFSEKAYGTGFKWRDIISQNPFLQQPGRVYYDESRKMWIAKIYPGEVVKIGNEVIIPSYSTEETTTTVITQPASGLSSIPWWGWLCILGGIALLVWLFWFYRGNGTAFSSSSAAIHIDIRNGVDVGTRATLLGREQDFRDHALSIIERGARKQGRLTQFELSENTDNFFVKAKYSERFGRKETKKEDQK